MVNNIPYPQMMGIWTGYGTHSPRNNGGQWIDPTGPFWQVSLSVTVPEPPVIAWDCTPYTRSAAPGCQIFFFGLFSLIQAPPSRHAPIDLAVIGSAYSVSLLFVLHLHSSLLWCLCSIQTWPLVRGGRSFAWRLSVVVEARSLEVNH